MELRHREWFATPQTVTRASTAGGVYGRPPGRVRCAVGARASVLGRNEEEGRRKRWGETMSDCQVQEASVSPLEMMTDEQWEARPDSVPRP